MTTEFQRDTAHWLYKLSPEEWIQSALAELRRAESALASGVLPPAYAGLKRAAGMALNAALIRVPNPSWGRSYVDHLHGLSEDASAPEVVRGAARSLLQLKATPGQVVTLRTPRSQARWVDAAKTVMAHGYAVAHGSAGAGGAAVVGSAGAGGVAVVGSAGAGGVATKANQAEGQSE